MAAEIKKEIELEIAYVLFIDIVGYSKLLIDDQRELQQQLNQIVRNTEQFRTTIRNDRGFFRGVDQNVISRRFSLALRNA
jgi:hypothetical protein